MNYRGVSNLTFASPDKIASLTRGRTGNRSQWMGLCPCHNDTNPSLSIRWGRNGQTLVKCHAGCTQDQLLAYFRGCGYRLDKGPPPRAKRPRRAVPITASIAVVAVTKSERLMLDMIRAGDNPTYDDFERAGVRHQSISRGLRVLEALGFVAVDRRPFNAREGRYEHNRYSPKDGWIDFEPDGRSPKARKMALAEARRVAGSARKGEAIASDAQNEQAWASDLRGTVSGVSKVADTSDVQKEQEPVSDLRGAVSEGPFRGAVSHPTSYGREGGRSPSTANDATESSRSRPTDGREAPKVEAAAEPDVSQSPIAGMPPPEGRVIAFPDRRAADPVSAAARRIVFVEQDLIRGYLDHGSGRTRAEALAHFAKLGLIELDAGWAFRLGYR